MKIKAFLILSIISLFYFFYSFKIYYVFSGSMEPTIYESAICIFKKMNLDSNIYKFNRTKTFSLRNKIISFKFKDNNIIKRVIGLPGDSINKMGEFYYINNVKESTGILKKYNCSIKFISNQSINDFQTKINSKLNFIDKNKFFISCSEIEYNKLLIDSSIECTPYYDIKNYSIKDEFNSNYLVNFNGNFVIPFKGLKIKLDSINFNVYKNTILNFEKENIEKFFGKYYEFKNNYFFLIGDNRMESYDSRNFGFVPQNLITGILLWKIN